MRRSEGGAVTAEQPTITEYRIAARYISLLLNVEERFLNLPVDRYISRVNLTFRLTIVISTSERVLLQ